MELIDALPVQDTATYIIVPSNRLETSKVRILSDAARARSIPISIHERGHPLSEDLTLAETGLSWMYSQIISPVDLNRYPQGILNMHGGTIPEYRGASVLHWAIINGEQRLGITWHEMVEAVDAGPVWAESTIPIPTKASASDLRIDMIAEGIRLFPNAWERFRNPDAIPRYPNLADGRAWPQRGPSDGLIEPGWPSERVYNIVRALCPPWPPAFMDTDQGKVNIGSVLAEPRSGAIPYLTADGITVYLLPALLGLES